MFDLTDVIWLVVAMLLFFASGGIFGYLYAIYLSERSNFYTAPLDDPDDRRPWERWLESGKKFEEGTDV